MDGMPPRASEPRSTEYVGMTRDTVTEDWRSSETKRNETKIAGRSEWMNEWMTLACN